MIYSEALVSTPGVMGILNVTPDSFFDGGAYVAPSKAYDRAMVMIDEGAAIIDIGGESSRPGALPVSTQQELDRVIPVIERVRATHAVCLSIDTSKASVMSAAVQAGASMINDVCALREEGALAMAARLQVPVCLMHMQGKPVSMQASPSYSDEMISDLHLFFNERIEACLCAGLSRDLLWLDPGFGFGKSHAHNLKMLKNVNAFQAHGLPIILGVSRKQTLRHVLGQGHSAGLIGGIALAVYAVLNGVSIIRTHDVAETVLALNMIKALQGI